MTTHELTDLDTVYGAERPTLASYIAGFLLSIILTLIPYTIAKEKLFDGMYLVYVISFFAVVQLLVQLMFFLHLSKKSRARWNLVAALFTLFMVAFLVVGSIWIMANLSDNTMTPLRLNNMMSLMHGD